MFLVVAITTWPTSGISANTPAPRFELLKWESPEKVKLDDFAGKIIILDFFAYWCAPCRKASSEIEGGIQKYYASKNGNPHGAPVQVVSINIEKDNPKLTARYIKDTGIGFVLNDFTGDLLEKLGGTATPFIAVIDGTHSTRATPDFRLVYKNAGFKGTKHLRSIIDGIKPPPKPAAANSSSSGIIETASGPPVERRGEISFESFLSSDIKTTSTTIGYGQKHGDSEWRVNYILNTFSEDYEPFPLFDFLGFQESLSETYNAGIFSFRRKLSEPLTLSVSGGGSKGFTDYRSLWLANYYKQQFSFVPGYESPEPFGYNASTGLRWEYLPATAFLDASFFYAYNEIAPGYEFEPVASELLQGQRLLETYSPTLRFENLVTRRIRMLNEFQTTFTTGRETRFAYRNSLNLAVGEKWVMRSLGGYTFENPTLRAWYAGATIEYEIAPPWLVNISGLYYHDTGEIENSAFISTAAPGLATWQGGLGLRYAGEISSFSISVAPVWSNYDPVSAGTRPFTFLYRDRDWVSIQAALSIIL